MGPGPSVLVAPHAFGHWEDAGQDGHPRPGWAAPRPAGAPGGLLAAGSCRLQAPRYLWGKVALSREMGWWGRSCPSEEPAWRPRVGEHPRGLRPHQDPTPTGLTPASRSVSRSPGPVLAKWSRKSARAGGLDGVHSRVGWRMYSTGSGEGRGSAGWPAVEGKGAVPVSGARRRLYLQPYHPDPRPISSDLPSEADSGLFMLDGRPLWEYQVLLSFCPLSPLAPGHHALLAPHTPLALSSWHPPPQRHRLRFRIGQLASHIDLAVHPESQLWVPTAPASPWVGDRARTPASDLGCL